MSVASVRESLVELHQTLIDFQRREVEKTTGRMSDSDVLQALTEDLRFAWLRAVSELIAALDASVAEGAEADAKTRELVAEVRRLLDPPDPDVPFGTRYLASLQRDPAIGVAHGHLMAALG